ncbi:MAG: hypothetical protein GX640_15955 [Fibrobacter sp.]|nr:hypothetical protein [Fibrobacter sp.]
MVLPLSIQNQINWNTLEIAKGDWIDRRLREHRSDVLYRARLLKNDQWVNFLFEHKSEPDKKTHKQLLNYILESWDLHEQQEPSYELLPVVISIIVYHGKKSWKIENSIKPLIAIIEETQDCVPDFKAFLLDLSAFDLEIIADSMLKMFLLTLKYGKNANLFSILPQIISISEKIDHNGRSDDYLRVVLTYLGAIINSDEKDKFWKIVAEEHRDGEEFMETIADALRKEERLKREKIEREAAILREKIIQKNTELKQMETELKLMETEIKQMEIEIERKDDLIEIYIYVSKHDGFFSGRFDS